MVAGKFKKRAHSLALRRSVLDHIVGDTGELSYFAGNRYLGIGKG